MINKFDDHTIHGGFLTALMLSQRSNEARAILQSGAGIRPGSYRLVAQYPRRVISLQELSTSATLADAGLTSRQEALLLEPLREQE